MGKKANKDWGYLGIREPKKHVRTRNGASLSIKCGHSYQIDGSGHGFCIYCGREVQFPYDRRGEMQVIKEGDVKELTINQGGQK